MTDIGELVAVSNIADDKEKCPFCPSKNLDDCKQAQENKIDEKVISKPAQLGCVTLTPKGDYSYTTARHHLISAKQCYAKLKKCVRMGSLAGYDINDPPNGIALPTVANDLRYTVGTSQNCKYGKLSGDEKKEVSFSVMKTESAQWHVGHHAVKVEVCEHWADEEEDSPWRRGHETSYDSEVISKLLKLLSKYDNAEPCDDTKPDKFKSDMDELSAEIKGKLNKFKTDSPSNSEPFYVSRLAYQFAEEGVEEESGGLP